MSRPTPGGQTPAQTARNNVGHVKGGQSPSAQGQTSFPSAAVAKDIKGLLSQPIRIFLQDGKQQTGLLWAYDAGLGALVLENPKGVLSTLEECPRAAASFPTSTLSSLKVAAQGGDASGSRTSFQIIKMQSVSKVERLQGADAAALDKHKLTEIHRDVNVAAAEAREKAATGEALKRASKIGVGVSTLGQGVFDALSKTLPCRWADRHIIVMDEIVISPDNYDHATVPQYKLSTLQALAEGKDVPGVPEDGRGKATRWQRVSKVLDGERKKILAASKPITTA